MMVFYISEIILVHVLGQWVLDNDVKYVNAATLTYLEGQIGNVKCTSEPFSGHKNLIYGWPADVAVALKVKMPISFIHIIRELKTHCFTIKLHVHFLKQTRKLGMLPLLILRGKNVFQF